MGGNSSLSPLALAAEERFSSLARSSPFDPSLLVDISERIVADVAPARLLSPLVAEPGRVVVTDARVYFRPLVDPCAGTPLPRSHELRRVLALAKRSTTTEGHRDVGLEVFFFERGDVVAEEEGGEGGAGGGRGGSSSGVSSSAASPSSSPSLPSSSSSAPSISWGAASALFSFRSRAQRDQVLAALEGVPAADSDRIIVAYEPIWAIGTGVAATEEDAQEACALIRQVLEVARGEVARRIRILYGGSAKPENAGDLVTQADVDGLLVGGASLEAESFAAIVGATAACYGQ